MGKPVMSKVEPVKELLLPCAQDYARVSLAQGNALTGSGDWAAHRAMHTVTATKPRWNQ